MEQGLFKAIKYFGSQKALAKVLGIKQQAINNWMNRQGQIPPLQIIKIVCLTKGQVTVEELASNQPFGSAIKEFLLLQKNAIQSDSPSYNKFKVSADKSKLFIEKVEKARHRKKIFQDVKNKLSLPNYIKISATIWDELVSKKMKFQKDMLVTISIYLQTCRHANIVGLYYLPLTYISYDTGIEAKKIHYILRYLQQINFCSYDFNAEFIWVHEMALYQLGELREGKHETIRLIQAYLYYLPKLNFLEKFHYLYKDIFFLEL